MELNTFLLILLVIANFTNLYLTHFKKKKVIAFTSKHFNSLNLLLILS